MEDLSPKGGSCVTVVPLERPVDGEFSKQVDMCVNYQSGREGASIYYYYYYYFGRVGRLINLKEEWEAST